MLISSHTLQQWDTFPNSSPDPDGIKKKKYDHYDTNSSKSVYKDDIEKYLETSEIIIGKNIDNIKNRKEILQLEQKYSKYIPIELIVLLVMSIIMILVGKLI